MKKIKVCLAWHSISSANYGVNALTISQLKLLSEAAKSAQAELEITSIGTPQRVNTNEADLICFNLPKIAQHHAVSPKLLLKDIFMRGPIFRTLQSADLVLDIGEGDSFTDIYGPKRFLNLCTTKLVCFLLRKRQILAPQTIGPFDRGWTRLLARLILKTQRLIFVRDNPSKELLKDFGISSIEVADVAFSLPYRMNLKPFQERSIGVNVSALLWNGGYTGNNQFALKLDYRTFITNLVQNFCDLGIQVHLVAHVIDDNSAMEDDYRTCIEVASEINSITAPIISPKFGDAIEAKEYISRLGFFVGSRMHATIAAVSAGIPTIPIAYSRKFAGVFNSIDYPFVIDAKLESTDQALDTIMSRYQYDYDTLTKRAHISRGIAAQSNRLYSNELSRLF